MHVSKYLAHKGMQKKRFYLYINYSAFICSFSLYIPDFVYITTVDDMWYEKKKPYKYTGKLTGLSALMNRCIPHGREDEGRMRTFVFFPNFNV